MYLCSAFLKETSNALIVLDEEQKKVLRWRLKVCGARLMFFRLSGKEFHFKSGRRDICFSDIVNRA